jgi:WW domain
MYYVHPTTGRSSWSAPGISLPSGWKEIQTPDGRPFYVHEELQLSTWTWPGQQPVQIAMPQVNQLPAQKRAVPRTGKPIQSNVASRRTSAAVSGVGMAAKFSASAADMASDPITGATKAVTKGVMLAAKSFKNNKNARKMFSRVGMKSMKQITETAISAGGDGYDVDLGDDDGGEGDCGEGEDAGLESCGPAGFDYGSNDCTTTEIDQGFNSYPQQDVHLDPGHVDPRAEAMYGEPFMQQGSNIDSCGQVSNFPAYYQETPLPLVNKTTMAKHTETSNDFIDQSVNSEVVDQSPQNCVDEAVNNNQSSDQTTQDCADQSLNDQVVRQGTQSCVGSSSDNQFIGQGPPNWDADHQPASNIDAQPTEVVTTDNQNSSVSIPPPTLNVCDPEAEGTPVPSVADPCSNSYYPSDPGPPTVPEEAPAPAPFVFQPVLAAPMIVEPAASSDGVVFSPQYPSIYDSSDALALI